MRAARNRDVLGNASISAASNSPALRVPVLRIVRKRALDHLDKWRRKIRPRITQPFLRPPALVPAPLPISVLLVPSTG